MLEEARPSAEIVKFVNELHGMAFHMQSLNEQSDMIKSLINQIFRQMTLDKTWESERGGQKRFGYEGTHPIAY